MLDAEIINKPGEHPFFFTGLTGQLEAVLTVPEQINTQYLAIIGHPHSLQGGTMNNKVVTTLVRTFNEMGIASIRFNFRGVGQSQGVYDKGIGESTDMLALANDCKRSFPEKHIIFAGFSFGSYVAYRAASQCEHALLITVAPPVHHFNYNEFIPAPSPWVVVQGDKDDVVPLQVVLDAVNNHSPKQSMLLFKDTGHFFHGKLIELKERLIQEIRQRLGHDETH